MNVDDRLLQLRQLERRLADMAGGAAAASGGGGGQGGSGRDDAGRKALEEQVRRNADDVRALLRGVVAAGLVIIGMIVGLYAYVGTKTDALNSQLQAIRVEQAQSRGELNVAEAEVAGRLDRIGDRLARTRASGR